MKLVSTSLILTIATTLTTVMVGSIISGYSFANAAGRNSSPTANIPTAATLIAKGESKSLAKQLQGKPVVVDIYASWCPGCKNIAPTLSQLKKRYGSKVNFVVFDVSDSKTTQAAMKTAEKLGLTNFFNANKSQTATVTIFDPATGKIAKQLRNNADLTEYTSIIDSSISKMSSTDAMKKP
jgi:thiol-disulfide isomerase/thioredoxin